MTAQKDVNQNHDGKEKQASNMMDDLTGESVANADVPSASTPSSTNEELASISEDQFLEKEPEAGHETECDVDGEEACHGDTEHAEKEHITALDATVSGLQKELHEMKDQVLRYHAEAQNVKKRAQADIEKAHKFALDRFVDALLPVVDSLERGLLMESEENAEAMKEGIELTLKLFMDTMQKFNIEPIMSEGELFNPELHQAMSQIENSDVKSGMVIQVFQKGYTLNGRLVRPAMVIVAK